MNVSAGGEFLRRQRVKPLLAQIANGPPVGDCRFGRRRLAQGCRILLREEVILPTPIRSLRSHELLRRFGRAELGNRVNVGLHVRRRTRPITPHSQEHHTETEGNEPARDL